MPRRPLALAVLALAAACQQRGALPPQPARASSAGDPAAPQPPPATIVNLVAPTRVRHAPRVLATGTLKARSTAPLGMTVPGTLARVAVRRGDEVKEGALLAALDDGAALAARKQAEAAVAAARAQLALAEDAFGRTTRLREQESASEAQLVQSRSQRDLAAAQLAAAEAQLDQARVTLAHHTLRAPFPGVVTRVPDGLGVAVAAGAPLVTLVSTGALVLETSLTQAEAAELRCGAAVTVVVPATGARTGDGRLDVVVPAVDPATNRVPVEIVVPNADERFMPNAFARAELPRGSERDAYRIPAGALVQRAGEHAAWTAGVDGKARALPVRVLAEDGDGAVVLPPEGRWPDGLRAVEAPPLGLSEGTLVAEARR